MWLLNMNNEFHTILGGESLKNIDYHELKQLNYIANLNHGWSDFTVFQSDKNKQGGRFQHPNSLNGHFMR